MKIDEIRERYLDFFKSKDHRVCESDVLVPKWDNTVLFTPAGMNPFKDHFLGNVELEFTRATSCQKCLRTGDIENVGRTAYHHTFFEMLGNFSFGDYFKKDAIHWAWEFLTDKKWLGVDPGRLTVTVFLNDDEAFDIWNKDVGLSPDRITRLDEWDNFWPAGAPTDGPDGVCGPCSEIFYHPDEGGECEIWNLVFTQFNREGSPPDNLSPLPSKNIDTGMGLERIAATLQGVETNFHIDSLRPVVEAAAEICGVKYEPDSEDGRRLRRITDHVRACTMAIHENVYPDNQKENYVIRRLLRRGVLQGHEMGLRDPFLYQLVPAVVQSLARPYPDLSKTAENVARVIQNEESRFLSNLDNGLGRIEKIFSKMDSSGTKTVDGKEAFDLYQTFGIPAELFASIASDRKCEFDWDGYNSAKDQHALDSGTMSDGVMGNFGPLDEIKGEVKSTQFLGYEETEETGVVCGLIDGESRVQELSSSTDEQIVILDRSPFYAESGGQVGDTGVLRGAAGEFAVTQTVKSGDVWIHQGTITQGRLVQGETVTAVVDSQRRSSIERAHSATHIMHYALQQNLGAHAQQRGSKVEGDQLRFDFANDSAVTAELLSKIESDTNQRVAEKADVRADTLPLESAREQGAMMLFGEKYPDPVRMVSIGSFSKELCGGTHVDNTGEIEAFEILAEESVSAGTRRIVAVTGQKAKENQQKVQLAADHLARQLDVQILEIAKATSGLTSRVKDLKKQLSSGTAKDKPDPEPESKLGGGGKKDAPTYFQVRDELRKTAAVLNVPLEQVTERVDAMLVEVDSLKSQVKEMASAPQVSADDLIAGAELVGDMKLIVKELVGANPGVMKKLLDQIRKKADSVAVFLAVKQGDSKVLLNAAVSRDLVERGFKAGDWVKEVAPVVGGGGGGKPDMASAGGKQPENLGKALEAAAEFAKSKSAAS